MAGWVGGLSREFSPIPPTSPVPPLQLERSVLHLALQIADAAPEAEMLWATLTQPLAGAQPFPAPQPPPPICWLLVCLYPAPTCQYLYFSNCGKIRVT